MRVLVIALLAALTAPVGSTPAAASESHKPVVVTNPDWITKPDPADMQAAYPKDAMMKGVEGAIVLECEVEVDTTLSACKAITEDPPNMGFGAAGIALAVNMRMKPKTVDGVPVRGAQVRIPLRFRVGKPPWSLDDAERCLGVAQVELTGEQETITAYARWVYAYSGMARSAGLSNDQIVAHIDQSRRNAQKDAGSAAGIAESKKCYDFTHPASAQATAPPSR
ncbi:MAG TPA: TonB family protein [Caulobacteraceae bacterium]|jgi:TonB family protein|nr:TonB family protein [Caulobacteraceae bacterium]